MSIDDDSFRTNVPQYDDVWDDLIYHHGWAYPVQGEVEIACIVDSENRVRVAGHAMTPEDARRFIDFVESTDQTEEGPCGLARAVTFETKGQQNYRVPGHILASVVTWLKNALGDEPYDGPSDRWEY